MPKFCILRRSICHRCQVSLLASLPLTHAHTGASVTEACYFAYIIYFCLYFSISLQICSNNAGLTYYDFCSHTCSFDSASYFAHITFICLYFGISVRICFINMGPFWPDLAKFHHFGNIFKVYLVLGKVFNSLWHNLYAIRHIFSAENGQIFKTQFVHLVTLHVTYLKQLLFPYIFFWFFMLFCIHYLLLSFLRYFPPELF